MAASNTIRHMIAAEAAAEILSQKLEMLLSHPVRTRCLLREPLAKEAKEKLATIQEFFSTQDRLSQSTVWLRRFLQTICDAEEFIDKFHLREACSRHKTLHMATRPTAALISKYKLWRDLSNLVNKMQELGQDQGLKGQKEAKGKTRNDPGCSSSPASVPGQGEKLVRLNSLWYRQASENFLRQKEKKILKERFVKGGSQGELSWTSIWGEQGTGKTFLARWAFGEAMDLGFKWRAWVRLSASMDMPEFLFEILKQLGGLTREPKDMDLGELKALVYHRLAERTKFLIVLDDVHSSNEQLLQMFLQSLPFRVGGHIITTTQAESVAKSMSSPEAGPIELRMLDPEKSQEMLATRLYRVPDGKRLSKKEKDILNMCRGLPLYISLLSGFLSNAREGDCAALVKEGFMTKLDILQLSVHKLPIYLKPCFIYMALFPAAFPIPTRRLVKLWLAEGLLDSHCYNREGETTRMPEDVGEAFILELADRNVIDVVSWRADGFPKACQMLTSLYDMICQIAMTTGFLHVHAAIRNPTGQQQQLPAQLLERTKVRWLAEHTNIVTDSHDGSFPNLYLDHVRSFLSFYMRRGILTKDISTFLRIMTSKTAYSLLRVLDLEGVYKPSLQGVLHKLVLLRYLGLRCTMLDSLPREVADMYYLETLDIKHTNITSLPSSLWKARNLRHLHLNWSYIDLKKILKACRNNVMALTKLRTLSGLVISEVKENLMRDPVGSLTTLTTLKLFLRRSGGDTSGAAEKAVADWISFRLTNLQSLTFGVTQKAKPVKEVRPAKKAIRKTSRIGLLPKLSLAEKHHDLLELYLLGQLDKPIWTQLLPGSLRVLTLSGSKVEADMMPQLVDLLKNLRTLRLLANSFLGTCLRFAKDGFPSLMILKIWKLPCLEEVIIEPGAMLHLKELEFRHLDAMKNVEGIKECKELKNIRVVVKKGAQGSVKGLKDGTGETGIASKTEETDVDEDDSWDDDEE